MGDRHRFRAIWHDYNEGIYFITICSYKKRYIFGQIKGNIFYPSSLGHIIDENLAKLEDRNNGAIILNHVIMPNHIHLMLLLEKKDEDKREVQNLQCSQNYGALKPPKYGDPLNDNHHNSRLASLIGSFKAGVTREARRKNIIYNSYWQKSFHEHIVTNQHSFDRIMNYISTNIENWEDDCFNGIKNPG